MDDQNQDLTSPTDTDRLLSKIDQIDRLMLELRILLVMLPELSPPHLSMMLLSSEPPPVDPRLN